MGTPARSKVCAALGAMGLSVLVAACGSDPLAPEDVLVRQGESAHFVYYATAGDGVDADFQERHYAWAMQRLGLSFPEKIEYRKYRDREHLRRVTGENTNGVAEPHLGRFHIIWPQDNHEYIHVVWVSLVGDAPALFNEGVAVAHHGASVHGAFDGDPLWSGVSVHERARGFREDGVLPDLADLAVTGSFRGYDSEMTYPVAGSFVRYLIDEAGVERFKDFAARSLKSDSLTEIEADFQAAYGQSLRTWWERWLAFLSG